MFGQILAALQRIPEADLTPEPEQSLPRQSGAKQAETPTRSGGRPVSPAMTSAVRLLESNPQLTAGDLVRELGVTKSYARTLLRRAKEKAPPMVQPTPQSMPLTPAPSDAALHDLQRRLAHAEQNLQELTSAPTRTRTSFGRSNRSQVVQLAEKGESPDAIAASLELPRGEVDFILKVEKILLKTF